MRKIAILGAGISGLSLAWFLQKQHKNTLHITLFEKASSTGGLIKTIQHAKGYFECGPRSLRAVGKESVLSNLLSDLGLQEELIFPQKALPRYVAKNGSLHKVPQSIFALKLLSRALISDLFAKRGTGEDESCASFFERRCGKKFVQELLDPLICGIYATTSDAISIQSAFPLLQELEKRFRSLCIGSFFKKKSKGEMLSFTEGIQTLPQKIARKLTCDILLNEPVRALFDKERRAFVVTDSKTHEFDFVISTLPANALSPLLASGDPLKPILDSIKMTSLFTASFGFYKKQNLPPGFGFLSIPSYETDLLGIVFDSNVFLEHNGAFPTRLSVMMKREDSGLKFLNKYLNIGIAPDFMHTEQLENAICRYEVGHSLKIAHIETLTKERSIAFLGASFYGPAVGDCIESAFTFTKKRSSF